MQQGIKAVRKNCWLILTELKSPYERQGTVWEFVGNAHSRDRAFITYFIYQVPHKHSAKPYTETGKEKEEIIQQGLRICLATKTPQRIKIKKKETCFGILEQSVLRLIS